MKKFLLLCLTAAAGVMPAMAEIKTPVIYPDAAFQRITPDGRYALSEVYGQVTIYDLVENTRVDFYPDDMWVEYYGIGLGNCITPDGKIVVASTLSQTNAAYYENNEWHYLNVANEDKSNLSNGITPDGSRICGSIGLSEMTLEETIMQVPVYWERNADGDGYGDYKALPYPEKDLFGQTPQYVTAIAISDDGKTIVGQMVFSSGRMVIPVVYIEDDKGEWSYSLPTKSLFNPDNIEPVENPGDGPTPPSYEDYMTEDEIAQYQAAVTEFFNQERPNYPDYEEFMTEDEIAQYQAAYADYRVLYEEWEEKYVAYEEYAEQVYDSSPTFVFNNVMLSTDGKKIVSTLEAPDPNADPWAWFSVDIYTPATVDIATGELVKVDTELSLLASGVADDGVILAFNGQGSLPMLGYVIKNGEVLNLIDYLNTLSPEYGEWITHNLSHEVVVDYDPETWEEIFAELTFTGMPVATPDMSVLTIWNDSPWDDMSLAEGVVFDLNSPSGIAAVGALSKNVKIVANATLSVPDGYSRINVYNLNGVNVESVAAPAGIVKLDVTAGAYIVKATRADGSTQLIKLAAH